jgi:putative membrane protein
LADSLAARVYAIRRPSPQLLWQYLVHSLAGFVMAPLIFVPLFFRYHTLRYHFDQEGIRASWGILFRKEIFLTYARIQDIHVTRGLLERWLGIGTVQVQTASASSGAELSIVGLTQYEEVRDFLYGRMRGVHAHDGAPALAPGAPTAQTHLTAILEELRALNQALGGGR